MISTDEVYYSDEMTNLLTGYLDDMNTDIAGKDPANHDHSVYS